MTSAIAPEASVEAIFLCFASPEDSLRPMASLDEVLALEGLGLISVSLGSSVQRDRYCLRGDGADLAHQGFHQTKDARLRNVTLIAEEDIEAANAERVAEGLEVFAQSETRRNIVTRGVILGELVGEHFEIIEGESVVRLVGAELCKPCKRPSQLTDKPDFLHSFQGRGGLRATILSSGVIRVGSRIEASAG